MEPMRLQFDSDTPGSGGTTCNRGHVLFFGMIPMTKKRKAGPLALDRVETPR
jgi:hypothetical protein